MSSTSNPLPTAAADTPVEAITYYGSEDLEMHPVLTKSFFAITPAFGSAYKIVRDRVWTHATGLVLYARPRTGKTRCLRAIQQSLMVEFPRVMVTLISSDESNGKAAKSVKVIEKILTFERLVSSRPRDPDPLERLVFHVALRTASLGGAHWVLMIDEMQMMDSAQFTKLLVLTNALEDRGITTTVIGSAQPEILNLGGMFKHMNRTNLTARFLSELVRFDGCTSEEFLVEILRTYDEELIHPPASGCSYTKFFLPEAFVAGVRLQEAGHRLWAAFHAGSDDDVELEPIFRAVQYLLLEGRKRDSSNFRFSATLIKTAVEKSGLAGLRSL